MRYRILGPLEVWDGARPVPLGQGRQRVLLAMLLVHANETLSRDRLIDALWGETPPPTASRSLHNLVSALRKALADGALVTRNGGYELRTTDGELDARRFAALAGRGRAALDAGDAAGAAATLREALGLWRGPPLADVAYESAVLGDAARLDERRLEAIEDRIDADLALGRHSGLLIELDELAAEHPTRERIRAQQMLALYRAGRQAEALRAFGDARRHLVGELGLEPGPALRRLERAILEQDPSLEAPGAPPAAPAATPPSSRRRVPVALVASGVLVLAAGLVAALLSGGSDRRGQAALGGDSVAVIDPATNRIVAQYPVGGTPTVVTAAGGAVWTVNADGQTISRIDQRAKTVRTFAVDAVPLDAAAGDDALWAVTGNRDWEGKAPPTTLARLDAISGATLATTTLRPARGQAFLIPPQIVAVGDGAVWALGRTRRLQRVDARTGAVKILRSVHVNQVATGAGQVWAVGDGPRGPRLLQLDPGTGDVVRHVDVPASGEGPLAVGASAVWLGDTSAGTVWRVDTDGSPVLRTVALEEGVDAIALGAGAVWVANGLSGTVARIDPETDRVTTRIAVGNTPRSVVVSGGRVWVTVAGGGRPTVPAAGSLRPGSRVTPLTTSACGPVLTGAGGDADVLVGADLPLGAAARSTTQSMAAAIAFVLREHRFRAGRFRLGLQTCDDSTAQSTLPFDSGKCESNAKAYAADRSVVGVIGPVHSGCTGEMLPTLNRAPGGPLAVISPANTAKFLVRRDPTDPAGQLDRLYPRGQRGYARIMPTEDYEVAAEALMARRLGRGSAFSLEDAFTAEGPYRGWLRFAARRVGLHILGVGTWDPERRSYRRLAERVRASGAHAVLLLGSLTTNEAQMVRDLRAVMGRRIAIILGAGGAPLPDLFEQVGDAARGVHLSAGGPLLDRSRPAGRRFAQDFGATQPAGRVTTFDAYTAAATEVMIDAIARSDGTRASVSRQLTAVRLADSPIGPVSFDARGEQRSDAIAFARAERDARGVPSAYNDVTGGVVEAVVRPSARVVPGAG